MSSFGKPIIITAAMASDFWATIGIVAGQFGKPIKVQKIVWNNPGAAASFVITDASTAANVLKQGNTPTGYIGPDPEYDFVDEVPWRNWKVTTLSAGTLFIYYR